MKNELDNTVKMYLEMVGDGRLSVYEFAEAILEMQRDYGVEQFNGMLVDRLGNVWKLPVEYKVPRPKDGYR